MVLEFSELIMSVFLAYYKKKETLLGLSFVFLSIFSYISSYFLMRYFNRLIFGAFYSSQDKEIERQDLDLGPAALDLLIHQ